MSKEIGIYRFLIWDLFNVLSLQFLPQPLGVSAVVDLNARRFGTKRKRDARNITDAIFFIFCINLLNLLSINPLTDFSNFKI